MSSMLKGAIGSVLAIGLVAAGVEIGRRKANKASDRFCKEHKVEVDGVEVDSIHAEDRTWKAFSRAAQTVKNTVNKDK